MANDFFADIALSGVSGVTGLKVIARNSKKKRLGADFFDFNGFASIDTLAARAFAGRNPRIRFSIQDTNGDLPNYTKNGQSFNFSPSLQRTSARLDRNELEVLVEYNPRGIVVGPTPTPTPTPTPAPTPTPTPAPTPTPTPEPRPPVPPIPPRPPIPPAPTPTPTPSPSPTAFTVTQSVLPALVEDELQEVIEPILPDLRTFTQFSGGTTAGISISVVGTAEGLDYGYLQNSTSAIEIVIPGSDELTPDGSAILIASQYKSFNGTASAAPLLIIADASVSPTGVVTLSNSGKLITGSNLDDTIIGGRGRDTINGLSGDDFIFGAIQADQLLGNAGSDEIDGFTGNDTITGGLDADLLTGGFGNDVFVFATGDSEAITGTFTDPDGTPVAGNAAIFDDGVDVVTDFNGNSATENDIFRFNNIDYKFGDFATFLTGPNVVGNAVLADGKFFATELVSEGSPNVWYVSGVWDGFDTFTDTDGATDPSNAPDVLVFSGNIPLDGLDAQGVEAVILEGVGDPFRFIG